MMSTLICPLMGTLEGSVCDEHPDGSCNEPFNGPCNEPPDGSCNELPDEFSNEQGGARTSSLLERSPTSL